MRIFRNTELIIKPDFCVLLSLFLLILPLPWVFAWFIAAAFHEICHLFVLKIYNIRVHSVTVSFRGAEIKTESMEPVCELLACAAGPLGGFLLMLLLRTAPAVAVCALIQSVYNLFPLYPLDGGRILNCIIAVFSDRRNVVSFLRWFPTVFSLVLVVFVLTASYLWNLGMMPVIAGAILAAKNIHIKFPCKADKQIVQ